MSWDRDSLWAKSCVFMERAFHNSSDDPLFSLWAAFGLELLARSALANVSPTLLAEPDREHRFLLHALGKGSEKIPKKSLSSVLVFQLCTTIFDGFSEEHKKVATAIINRRNEELHSGTCAFEEYPSSEWLVGFYRVCKALCACQGKGLEELFGTEEAENAESLLTERDKEITSTVLSKIAEHLRIFQALAEVDQKKAKLLAEQNVTHLSWQGYHKAACPACGSAASIAGETYGHETVSHEDGEVIVRQPLSPRGFHCSVCGLRLNGYAELEVAKLGGRYTRTASYSPEEYFGLVDPDDFKPESEYDNE